MKSLTILFLVILGVTAIVGFQYGPNRKWTAQELIKRSQQPPQTNIVGGADADIDNFRYQISMRYRGSHICGGSAISDAWVLTAAHCIVDYPNMVLEDWTIFGASNERSNDAQGLIFPTLQIDEHPNFVMRYFDNDVALYRTEGLLASGLITAIPLPGVGSHLDIGTIVTVSGWGTLQYGDRELPENLQYVNVPVVDWNICNVQHEYELTENHVCASEAGRDACQGDSGGPLVWGGVQYGIVSFGIDCADPRWAGVYTNVSSVSVRSYIHEITGI